MRGTARGFGPPRRRAAHARATRLGCRAGAAALLLLLTSCVYFSRHTPRGACTQDLGSPIRNFCVVATGVLWQGERPTPSDLHWLLEQRIGSVVSLQLDDRATFDALALPHGLIRSVRYYRVRGFNAVQLLSRNHIDERVALFLAIVAKAPKPVYVHCRAGVDRAVVLAEAYRIVMQGLDPEQAIAQVARFHSPWFLVESRYLRSLGSARRAALLRRARELERSVAASGEFHCVNGRCRYVPAAGTLAPAVTMR